MFAGLSSHFFTITDVTLGPGNHLRYALIRTNRLTLVSSIDT